MQKVEFQGQLFEFPAQASKEQIKGALSKWVEQQPTANGISTPDKSAAMRTEEQYTPVESYFSGAAGEQEQLQAILKLNGEQREFADAIAEVETGGLQNRSVRTQVKPNGGGAGSSAYGTYQITHGLLSGYLEQGVVSFSEQERLAAEELLRRQEISLAIGGRDRSKYESGGAKHGQAVSWAQSYGYETVTEFLDDFDYGGSLGLGNDAQFQVLYESFARRMLNRHLKDANGDPFKAARQWHGGPKGAGKKTDMYEQKVRKIYERSNQEG